MGATRDVLDGVKAAVVDLALDGLSTANIVTQWVKKVVPGNDADPLPRCVVCPGEEAADPAVRTLSNYRRVIPIMVVFVSSGKQGRSQPTTPKPVDWMDAAFHHFMQAGNLLPTVSAVDQIAVVPGAAVDAAAFDGADLWWSALTLNCRWKGSVT